MNVEIIKVAGVPTLRVDIDSSLVDREAFLNLLGGLPLPDKITFELGRYENNPSSQTYRLTPVRTKAK